MIAGDLPDIPEYIRAGSLRVHAPTPVVIVCGGKTNIDFGLSIASLRDAFMRISTSYKLSKFDIRKAEDVVKLPRPGYNDLLQLESDVAQISELILLFTESAGSLAELGIFIMDEEIRPRLMVVVDKFNYRQDSFIRLGAFEYLESSVGEQAVCVIDLVEFDAASIMHVSDLNIEKFRHFIESKIEDRIPIKPEPRTFDKNRNGHLIKLIVGLVQNYGALTLDEIDVLLYALDTGITLDKIKRLLGCAELFDWIKIEKVGTRWFYTALPHPIAVNFDLADSDHKINRRQWRTDIRDYWKKKDPDRFLSISNTFVGLG